jgi:CRP-like cAMP-binding protein
MWVEPTVPQSIRRYTTINEADFLAKVSLFSLMKKRALKRTAKLTRDHLFHEGDVTIKEGDWDGRLFIITSGLVEVIKNHGSENERYLRTMGPRSYLGEIALVDNLIRSASVVTKGDT